jgi:hypothetical protein
LSDYLAVVAGQELRQLFLARFQLRRPVEQDTLPKPWRCGPIAAVEGAARRGDGGLRLGPTAIGEAPNAIPCGRVDAVHRRIADLAAVDPVPSRDIHLKPPFGGTADFFCVLRACVPRRCRRLLERSARTGPASSLEALNGSSERLPSWLFQRSGVRSGSLSGSRLCAQSAIDHRP